MQTKQDNLMISRELVICILAITKLLFPQKDGIRWELVILINQLNINW
jgi:hypothetical protein